MVTRSTSWSLPVIEQGRSAEPPKQVGKIRPKQLRQLQALWHRWTKSLGLSRKADQQLRHYYVSVFTNGRALETLELTETDAIRAILRLTALVRRAESRNDYAAGTAGRHGFPEQRKVQPTYRAWRTLWTCAAQLGMQRQDLDEIIRRHYAGVGLRGIADMRTVADLNRVLWGLKEILRRRARPQSSTQGYQRAA